MCLGSFDITTKLFDAPSFLRTSFAPLAVFATVIKP
jgi:hypothetical protein